jgi:hypothetical protein
MNERLIPVHELDKLAKGCFPVRDTATSVRYQLSQILGIPDTQPNPINCVPHSVHYQRKYACLWCVDATYMCTLTKIESIAPTGAVCGQNSAQHYAQWITREKLTLQC